MYRLLFWYVSGIVKRNALTRTEYLKLQLKNFIEGRLVGDLQLWKACLEWDLFVGRWVIVVVAEVPLVFVVGTFVFSFLLRDPQT